MNSPRQLIGAIVVVALASLPACGGEGTAPAGPGTVAVSLVSPSADDGAVLVSITGPGIRNAEAASFNYHAYWRVVSATELRLIVVGDLAAGVVATVMVDDRSRIDQYQAQVVEVASRTDVVRSSNAGYSVTLTVP